MKRLTKSEKLLNEQMLALLEWASNHPKRWHDIGKLPETLNAAELLEKRGVIEIRRLCSRAAGGRLWRCLRRFPRLPSSIEL
jgi:hypothetical protein